METPSAAPPFFNPIVRLLNSSGEEVATNIFAGKGACSGAMTKSAQSKTIVPIRDPGDYTLEIRDATADLAGPDFQLSGPGPAADTPYRPGAYRNGPPESGAG